MRLIEYLPGFLAQVEDLARLTEAEQPELDGMQAAVDSVPDDFFMQSLSAEGVARWEKIMGVGAQPGESLEARRQRLVLKYSDQLPVTFRYMERWLKVVDARIALSVIFYAYTIRAVIPPGVVNTLALTRQMRDMVPANMVLEIGTNTPMVAHAGAALGASYSYMRIERS